MVYIMDFGMFLLTMINSLKLHRMDNEDGGILYRGGSRYPERGDA